MIECPSYNPPVGGVRRSRDASPGSGRLNPALRLKASGRIELTIRNLYDGLPVRRVAPCDGLEVRRTGKFISAARLNTVAVHDISRMTV